jgi:hypothetical protein
MAQMQRTAMARTRSWTSERLGRRAHVIATLATTAALAFPAAAAAMPDSRVDDSFEHFSDGSPGASLIVADHGGVQLKPTGPTETFDAPGLPSGFTETQWLAGSGAATTQAGSLKVNGVRVNSTATYTPQVAVEFRATFSPVQRQHVGLGDTLNTQPWAIFSTGVGTLAPGLYARTGGPGGTIENTLLSPVPSGAHTYRIEWAAEGVKYFVDGTHVATHAIQISTAMRVIASDTDMPANELHLDWLTVGGYEETGTFVSRVIDGGDPRAVWNSATISDNTGVAIETRVGDVAAPDGTWSEWTEPGPGGAIEAIGRYIQYRAVLTRQSNGGTPSLNRIELGFEVDEVAPATTIDDVDIDAGTATVSFSGDPDVARFECSRDAAGPFETCTSPHELDLDTGEHMFYVRAVDHAGNTGPVEQRALSIDITAPTTNIGGVAVAGDSATVSFSSPDGDVTRFECRLGDTGAFAACSSPKAFAGLAPGSYRVHVRAVDANGNTGDATSRSFTVPAPPPTIVPDTSGPDVAFTTKSVRSTRKGDVKVLVKCPAGEVRCVVTVVLKHRRKPVATKTLTVAGGTQRTVKLRLTSATKRRLARLGKLDLKAAVTASDHLGNSKKATYALKVRS